MCRAGDSVVNGARPIARDRITQGGFERPFFRGATIPQPGLSARLSPWPAGLCSRRSVASAGRCAPELQLNIRDGCVFQTAQSENSVKLVWTSFNDSVRCHGPR